MRQKKEVNSCKSKKRASPMHGIEAAFRLSTVILHGSRQASVYGCRKILHYSPTQISLQICNDVLTVCGSGLYCTSFSAGTVCLEGEIEQICFSGTHKERLREGSPSKEEA